MVRYKQLGTFSLNRNFSASLQAILADTIDLDILAAIDKIVAIHLSGAYQDGSPWRSFGHSKNRLGPCIPWELTI
jgi:hypothetical protein